jgi:hypothetical protein
LRIGSFARIEIKRVAIDYDWAICRGLYHADGQIDGEVFEYGSFVQSRMYHAGVTCSDCHEPHGLALREHGNGLCAQCHLPAKFDVAEHHHHQQGSAGAQCVNCHMASKTYMVVDERRDHSIRVPRPDLSASMGTPNACTKCHADKTANWAKPGISSLAPNALICALGTTIRKAGSKDVFARVDRDYMAAFAALGRAAGASHFGLVSAVGADARSSNFYLRTKGEAEAAVRACGYLRVDNDLLAERLVESGALDEVARLAREWFHRHLFGYSSAPDATQGAPSA